MAVFTKQHVLEPRKIQILPNRGRCGRNQGKVRVSGRGRGSRSGKLITVASSRAGENSPLDGSDDDG